MLNKDGIRELCYVARVDDIKPIPGRDRVECAIVGGWSIMVRKNQFQPGDLGIYFEIDSQVPEKEPFMFLEAKHFKIKTQKYKTPDGQFWSQGLLMSADDFGWEYQKDEDQIDMCNGKFLKEGDFLTKELGVVYADPADNKRKSSSSVDKYKKMAQRHGKLFSKKPIKWIMKHSWGRKVMFFFFGKKKDKNNAFPTKFPFIKKTDQERCENMTWVLEDKTPYIKTQKCDGSSATYILERKSFNKFEFYVCSRNIRQFSEKQKCFYEENYYWECAKKYDIENKMKDYMTRYPELEYVCWQGEICAPGIQKNPHHLKETHLYLFHMIDSLVGKYDIRKAADIWKYYEMETVPIVSTDYILPNNFELFKEDADGMYDASVCEGKDDCPREGFVYYKTSDPNFSFKNVSRTYLLKH